VRRVLVCFLAVIGFLALRYRLKGALIGAAIVAAFSGRKGTGSLPRRIEDLFEHREESVWLVVA
jgi:hypothetical protein